MCGCVEVHGGGGHVWGPSLNPEPRQACPNHQPMRSELTPMHPDLRAGLAYFFALTLNPGPCTKTLGSEPGP